MDRKKIAKKAATCCIMIAVGYGIFLCPVQIQNTEIKTETQLEDVAEIEKKEPEKLEEKEQPDERKDGWINTEAGWTYWVGNMQLKDVWLVKDEKTYHINAGGIMESGFVPLYDDYYYFSADGDLVANTMFEVDGKTYLTDSHGILLCGYQLYDGNRYYFGDDGVMLKNVTTPDGIYNLAEDGRVSSVNMESLTADCPLKNAPGTSGYTIGNYPLELFMLSMAGETSGARIILGDRGRAYGLCQFDYRYDLTDFINYAYETHPTLWFEFEPFVSKYAKGDQSLIGNPAILHAFQTAESLSPVNYAADQAEFLYRRYFTNTYKTLEAAGFCLSQRNISVSAALLSININCGSQTSLYLNMLSPSMTDEEMLTEIYNLRNTVLTAHRKETNTRFRVSEPLLAQQLSNGEVNANSSIRMSGGVEWDDRVLKYCGQYLTDDEIKVRYDEIGVSPYSAATLNMQATPSDAEFVEVENTEIQETEAAEEPTEEPESETSPVILAGQH